MDNFCEVCRIHSVLGIRIGANMANNRQKLELTWIGKENQPKLEPRILIEDPEKSYGHTPRSSQEGNKKVPSLEGKQGCVRIRMANYEDASVF